MPLFQNSVQKKFIAELNKEKVDAAYAKLVAHFGNPTIQENIRNAKEEQYQEGFLRELFVDVFGYTLHPQPNFNLITEQKNEKDSKKADGAILSDGTSKGFQPLVHNENDKGLKPLGLSLGSNAKKVVAVIELKSLKTTDLQSIEIQAFNYKNNQSGCVYVISSNFQKLRFYIEDAVNFEEFDLFDLSRERFGLLYFCLHIDSLLKDAPLRCKVLSLEKEEAITKKLYADYSGFRQALYKDIVQRNKQYDKVVLFKKTQKLLDRFLFIFFAEDKGLLQPNTVISVIAQWEKLKALDEYQPLYSRFKKHFGYLNNGYKSVEFDIFAYNGGLFAPDEILDSLDISDNLLEVHTRLMSHYDYDTDIDTNILGHIFEHSLNEIDEISATVDGAILDKTKTKRKKDGIFYTPKYITKYIVQQTVGELCRKQKTALSLDNEALTQVDTKKERKLYLDKIAQYRAWLLQITILDPACGSGAFLNEALEFLIAEHRNIDTMQATLFGDAMTMSDNVTEILENNIYGVDINEESVEIARLALWLRTAKVGRKLNDLSGHIKCGNSLISDPEVAGDLAFDWQAAFPKVFEKGGFDVVIGNPPYGILISKQEEAHFKNNFPLTSYKINLYILFIERTLKVFKNSKISFIIPKSLLFNSFYSNIRKFLLENVKIVELFTISSKVFEDAEVGGSLIITYEINQKENNLDNSINLVSTDSFNDFPLKATISSVKQSYFLDIPNYEIVIVDDKLAIIKDKILTFEPLSSFFNLKNGLNPGNIKHILIGTIKKDDKHKKIIWGKDISKYSVEWSNDYINYDAEIGSQIDISEIKSKAGMNKQDKVDFALRSSSLFEVNKILVRKTGDSLIAALDKSNFYFDTLVHGIYEGKSDLTLSYLLPILNSKPATFFYRLLHDIKGKVFAKISLDNLGSFPIPNPTDDFKNKLSQFSEKMLFDKKEFQKKSTQFQKLLQSNFPNLLINKKLEAWSELTFGELKKELEKQKNVLPLKQQMEWQQLFEEEKAVMQQLSADIKSTDQAIDKLVYALYELTAEEIQIIENQ